ncbi:MAG: L-threonylcarbamoyladenylate synthase, partial [Vicinamibacterales bacterium]
MIILAVDAENPDPALIAQAGAILAAGGVVAFPTDTVYGLAADPRQPGAVDRLYEAKGRDRGIAMPLIAASFEQAHAAALFGPAEQRLAEAFWPGPLSIIVPATVSIAPALRGPGGTVAIRVPDHAVARALAQALGFPITATSANLSGQPAATSGDAL